MVIIIMVVYPNTLYGQSRLFLLILCNGQLNIALPIRRKGAHHKTSNMKSHDWNLVLVPQSGKRVYNYFGAMAPVNSLFPGSTKSQV